MSTLPAKPFIPRSLVGMTQGARKRRARKVAQARGLKPYMLHEEYRIGQRLRPCPGCCSCGPCFGPKPCRRVCDGSGVLPERKSK